MHNFFVDVTNAALLVRLVNSAEDMNDRGVRGLCLFACFFRSVHCIFNFCFTRFSRWQCNTQLGCKGLLSTTGGPEEKIAHCSRSP